MSLLGNMQNKAASAALQHTLKKKAKSIVGDSAPLLGSSPDEESTSKRRTKSNSSSFSEKKTRGLDIKKPEAKKSFGRKKSASSLDDEIVTDTFKKLVYLFVARDSDMFVFENHLEPKIASAKFTAEVYEVLNYY